MTRKIRRNLLKGLAVSAPAAWTTPFVKSVILPAHAQTTVCSPFLSCSTDDPTSRESPAGTSLSGSGTSWGWNSFNDSADYLAAIGGLQAEACPGTNVTISLVDVASPEGTNATVGTGGNNPLTVSADASGVAAFSETVIVRLSGDNNVETPNASEIGFTLRFSSDDGAGPCDIPFCFTEYDPGGCISRLE